MSPSVIPLRQCNLTLWQDELEACSICPFLCSNLPALLQSFLKWGANKQHYMWFFQIDFFLASASSSLTVSSELPYHFSADVLLPVFHFLWLTFFCHLFSSSLSLVSWPIKLSTCIVFILGNLIWLLYFSLPCLNFWGQTDVKLPRSLFLFSSTLCKHLSKQNKLLSFSEHAAFQKRRCFRFLKFVL